MSRSNSRPEKHKRDRSRLGIARLAVFAVIGLLTLGFAPQLPGTDNVPGGAAARWASAESVYADEGGFTTESFKVSIATKPNHVFEVNEEINVDFSAPRHGLYRYIPDGGRYYGIDDIHVEGYNYEVYYERGNQVVQIGDPDHYVNGPQTYRINYSVIGHKDDDPEKDMLSLDLLPTGWPTPIQYAEVRMTLPKAVDDLKFYGGAYGNSGRETLDEYFDVRVQGGSITAKSKQILPRGTGLTVSADLPEGYWIDPASRDRALPLMYGALGILGMLMLLLWLFVGRDDPVIRTVEFYPPEEMDPLEIAYVANDRVATKDLAALFMYFADKGYASITSHGKKDFVLEKTGEIPLTEKSHVRETFHALFSDGNKVRMRGLSPEFGETATQIPSMVRDSVQAEKRTFSTASKAGRAFGLFCCFAIPMLAGCFAFYLSYGQFPMLLAGGACSLVIFLSMVALVAKTDAFRSRGRPVRIIISMIIVLAAILLETMVIRSYYPVLAAVFAASALAAVVATIFVRRRMNNELYGRVLGFRDFIKTAEYDRLKMLSDENPDYYFNILPYACIFGMSTKWADKFADFKLPPPAWYAGDTAFDPMFGHWFYVSSGNGLSTAVSEHYRAVGSEMLSAATDSSGSTGGFGGGGFSGGGFGGGGGGSW